MARLPGDNMTSKAHKVLLQLRSAEHIYNLCKYGYVHPRVIAKVNDLTDKFNRFTLDEQFIARKEFITHNDYITEIKPGETK